MIGVTPFLTFSVLPSDMAIATKLDNGRMTPNDSLVLWYNEQVNTIVMNYKNVYWLLLWHAIYQEFFIKANLIRVMVSIVLAQLIVLYLGLQMVLPFTKVLTTVGVVAFLEIVYHVVIARKIGANISFRMFWQTFKKVLRKNAAFLILLGVALIFFKSEDFMAFITWQLFFVVLVSDVIMALNDMPLSR